MDRKRIGTHESEGPAPVIRIREWQSLRGAAGWVVAEEAGPGKPKPLPANSFGLLGEFWASQPGPRHGLLLLMARNFGRVREDRGYWYVEVWAGGRRHRIYTVPLPGGHKARIRDAETAAEVLQGIREGIRQGRTAEQAVSLYVREKSARTLVRARWDAYVRGKKVSRGYRRELEGYPKRGYLEFFNSTAVWEVNFALLEDWVHWLRDRGLSEKTIKNILMGYRGFSRWLVQRGEIPMMPEFPVITTREPDFHAGSEAELQRVLERLSPEERGIFMAMGYMGLRPAEARALDRSDLEWEADGSAWLWVRRAMDGGDQRSAPKETKTNRWRRLPVDPELLAWIEEDQRRRGPMPGKALFVNPRAREGERRWTEDTLWRRTNRVCRGIGIQLTMYELTRKAFATAALNRDVPKEKVGAMLGHADPRTTDRYARYRDRSLITVLRPKSRTVRKLYTESDSQ